METEIMNVCNQEIKQKEEKKNRGFSLVELIVVVAIMAILAVVIAPQVMKYIDRSRHSADDSNIALYKTAISTALADEDAYKEVASASGNVTISVTAAGVTYTNVAITSPCPFKDELEEILQTTFPTPKQTGKTKFDITINVDTANKVVGKITVVAN